MSGFLGNNYFIHSHGPSDSHLDRGLYSSSSNMYGNPPSTNDQLAQFSYSIFWRNDYSISTTSACCFNVFNAGSNDFGAVGFKGNGDFIYYVKYNGSVYHNFGSGAGTGGTVTSAMSTADEWHHFHQICDSSGSNNVKVYLDGTLVATANANQQVDGWIEGWGHGSDRNGTSLISSVYQTVFGVTSSSHVKSPTYIAQMVYSMGNSNPTITEVLNSTADGPRNLLDINGDGTNTVLDTDRPGGPHQGNSSYASSGIFLFGANGTTDSDTHNSASQQGGTSFSVNNATRTQADPFPVPETIPAD